jgi:hypothetical protein
MKFRSKSRVQKRRKKYKLYGWIILAGIIAVLASFLYYVFSARFQINEVEVKGVTLAEKELIQKEAEKYLDTTLWKYIPRNNWLLIQTDLLRAHIQTIPAIKDAKVAVRDNKIVLTVIERNPTYLWCGEDREMVEECFFVDEEGIIFAEAPVFHGEAYLKFFKKIEGEYKGMMLATSSVLASINESVHLLEEATLQIHKVVLTSDTTATLQDESGFNVFISLESTPAEVIGRINAFKKSEAFTSFDVLEYVNIESEHKIFFKRKP